MANQGGSHGQNVKAGQQGKNQSAQQASGSSHSSSSKGAQGGSHEQHVKAGQQSHKKGH